MTPIDRRVVWVLVVVLVASILWLLLDHLLFPTLPVPAGAPSIIR